MRGTADEARLSAGDHEPVAREFRDRVVDWRVELRRLEPELHRLPLAARRAVIQLVARFQLEDTRGGEGESRPLDDAA